MPKLLHSQKGLKIVENDRNGFTVVTLHYTADPRKRSKLWLKEAKQGMSLAKFEQEYELSYDSMLGEKVWPEVLSRRPEIIFREGPFLDNRWPTDMKMFAGWDYGARNPSAFIVYAIYDKITWAIWELYKPCKNIIEYAEELKACPYWNQIRYIVADPDINTLKQRDMKSGLTTSVQQQFQTLGISKFTLGNTNEQNWLATMNKHWRGPEVTFKILENCTNLIDEFEQATYVTVSDRQLETTNFREVLIDHHNHALDATKYFMNSGSIALPSRNIKLPSLVDKYSPWQRDNVQNNQRLAEFY